MIKFEEVIEDIRNIAVRLSKKHRFSSPFEPDELVNEAWIAHQRSKELPSKYQILKRAEWDMVDYIRNQIGRHRRLKGKVVPRVKFITNMHHDKDYDRTDKENNHQDIFNIPTTDENFSNLENEELLIKLLLDNPPKENELEALFHYYFQEIKLREAGSIMDRTEAHACKLVKDALQKCQGNLEEMQLDTPISVGCS